MMQVILCVQGYVCINFDKITSIVLEKVYHDEMEAMRKPHSALFLGGTCNVMGERVMDK